MGWGHRDIVKILQQAQAPQQFAFGDVLPWAGTLLFGLLAVIAVPVLNTRSINAIAYSNAVK
jgi:hypothetical protein